jgi:hypothetical protein
MSEKKLGDGGLQRIMQQRRKVGVAFRDERVEIGLYPSQVATHGGTRCHSFSYALPQIQFALATSRRTRSEVRRAILAILLAMSLDSTRWF